MNLGMSNELIKTFSPQYASRIVMAQSAYFPALIAVKLSVMHEMEVALRAVKMAARNNLTAQTVSIVELDTSCSQNNLGITLCTSLETHSVLCLLYLVLKNTFICIGSFLILPVITCLLD